jgi:hypothetical protein
MKAVAKHKRHQYDWSFVPKLLRRPKPEAFSQGEQKLLMQPQPLAEVHPFTPTLKKWRHGILVDCGPDWKWDVITATVNHGPHLTARTQDSISLFEVVDIEYQIKAGFCKVYCHCDGVYDNNGNAEAIGG